MNKIDIPSLQNVEFQTILLLFIHQSRPSPMQYHSGDMADKFRYHPQMEDECERADATEISLMNRMKISGSKTESCGILDERKKDR